MTDQTEFSRQPEWLAAKKECDGMAGQEWLAERFEENRGHLKAVAYRMLGSVNEADDAVQEAWLRMLT